MSSISDALDILFEERLGGIGWYELCTELTGRAMYPCCVVVLVLNQLSEKLGNRTINSPKSVGIWNPHHFHVLSTNETKNMTRNGHVYSMHRNRGFVQSHLEPPGGSHLSLAALICDLGFVEGATDQTFCDKPKLLKTLSQLEAAQVHTLHWSLAAGIDDLVPILGTPGKFPHLNELVVSCDGTNKNFNFALVPRLELLGVEINLSSLVEDANMDWGVADRLCYRLAESLQMDMEGFPDDGYSDLIAPINNIHLPTLTTLKLSVDLVSDYWFQYGCGVPHDLPKTDFFPFFTSHPNLHHLKLNMPGI
ncbi:hypothetical protein B0H14DRAFT_2594022 [Mycena olivaceomarginata]|nr:hypothetical protein B0H14DRAFT_2594022 [Mycena olivaceomarginata]